MKRYKKERQAWFCSGLELTDIAVKMEGKGLCGSHDYDYENVYEWFEAETDDPYVSLNVSRKHSDFGTLSVAKEPISVMLMYDKDPPPDGVVEGLAQEISTLLRVSVHIGQIEYLRDDEYRYHSEAQVQPGS